MHGESIMDAMKVYSMINILQKVCHDWHTCTATFTVLLVVCTCKVSSACLPRRGQE